MRDFGNPDYLSVYLNNLAAEQNYSRNVFGCGNLVILEEDINFLGQTYPRYNVVCRALALSSSNNIKCGIEGADVSYIPGSPSSIIFNNPSCKAGIRHFGLKIEHTFNP